MQTIKYKNINQTELKKLFNRSIDTYKNVIPQVEEIIGMVRETGDKALFELTEKFDKVRPKSLEVTGEEVDFACAQSSTELKDALRQSIRNQIKFQSSLLNLKSEVIETIPGVKVWREWRPIEKVGLYVPGGTARYPSSIVMVVVPAILAGCREIVICSPVEKSGQIPNSTLTAVALVQEEVNKVIGKVDCKIRIFKLGGAQAIAAMAYGTQTIPKVYKVFGAGNLYVTAAKMAVFGQVDIDMPAGPSEVMVIADDSVNPSWIAADLISQCEHGEQSSAVLITNSVNFAKEVEVSVYEQANKLSTKETIEKSLKNYGAIILVDDWEQAIEIVNEFAPEHLELATENYLELKDKVVNAGSVFLGKYSTEPAGDYCSGSNHVLPTNGFAKMFEGLSIDSFGRQVEFQEVSKSGLDSLKQTIVTLATEEGLPAHANAVMRRILNMNNLTKM